MKGKKGSKIGEHYASGAFSCSTPAKGRKSGAQRKRQKVERPSESDVAVQFVNEDDIIVWTHSANKRKIVQQTS